METVKQNIKIILVYILNIYLIISFSIKLEKINLVSFNERNEWKTKRDVSKWWKGQRDKKKMQTNYVLNELFIDRLRVNVRPVVKCVLY